MTDEPNFHLLILDYSDTWIGDVTDEWAEKSIPFVHSYSCTAGWEGFEITDSSRLDEAEEIAAKHRKADAVCFIGLDPDDTLVGAVVDEWAAKDIPFVHIHSCTTVGEGYEISDPSRYSEAKEIAAKHRKSVVITV